MRVLAVTCSAASAVALMLGSSVGSATTLRGVTGSTGPSGGVPLTGTTAPAGTTPTASAPPTASGGGGLVPTGATPKTIPSPPSRKSRGKWLKGTTITQYWPAPESWFSGELVTAPGLAGEHRIDWLYSASGISMQGSGIGLDGQMYHIDALGNGGWLTVGGRATTPFNGWAGGAPYWRAGGFWRNKKGGVTFPLEVGGWSAGTGRRYVPLAGVTFAPGASLPLKFMQSIAVDPKVIPLGSEVYVPAYRNDGHGGWFVAQDTGGAINGHHVDVYRRPPTSSSDPGQTMTDQRIYVIKPK